MMTTANAAKDKLSDMPLPSAPFLSSVMQIEPQWIDHNGHLNMAYYNVMFDRAIDEMWLQLGMGPPYVRERQGASFTAAIPCRSRSTFSRPTRSACIRSKSCATPPKAGSPRRRRT